jgi:hypothetical protein
MKDKNLPVIQQSDILTKVDNKLLVTNKLLSSINNKWIEDFFYRNISDLMKVISLFYLFSKDEFDFFKEYIRIKELVENKQNCYILADDNIEKYLEELYFSKTSFSFPELIDYFDNKIVLPNQHQDAFEGNHYPKLDLYELSINRSEPLTYEIIEKYKNFWDWYSLSQSQLLPWNENLIEKYKNQLRWGYICNNKGANWDENLIDKYGDGWINWSVLSSKITLNDNLYLLEKYEDKWDWNSLSYNPNISWNLELLKKYEIKLNFSRLSRNSSILWDFNIIEEFKHKWNWLDLYYNDSLPWSIQLLEKFKDMWNWEYMSHQKRLLWNMDLIAKFEDLWDWTALSSTYNEIPWSFELIKRFEKSWNWRDLSQNDKINWNKETIKEFKTRIDWTYICWNNSVDWTFELIEEFKDQIDWNWLCQNSELNSTLKLQLIDKFHDRVNYFYLSSHLQFDDKDLKLEDLIDKLPKDENGLPNMRNLLCNNSIFFSTEFILKNESQLSFRFLSKSTKILWSIELISLYEDRWDWFYLSGNPSLPWSADFMKKFENKWSWSELVRNESICLTEEIIEIFINRWRVEEKIRIENIQLFQHHGGMGIIIESLLERKDLPISKDFLLLYEKFIFNGQINWGKYSNENLFIKHLISLISKYSLRNLLNKNNWIIKLNKLHDENRWEELYKLSLKFISIIPKWEIGYYYNYIASCYIENHEVDSNWKIIKTNWRSMFMPKNDSLDYFNLVIQRNPSFSYAYYYKSIILKSEGKIKESNEQIKIFNELKH